MAPPAKTKIVYVLPNYDPAAASHFFHLYGFLEAAARGLDVFVAIEKCKERPAWSFGFYCQKFAFPPLRMLELLIVLFRERLRGRRYFYIHYSFYGALASWLVRRLFGGRIYYWNSGEPWRYQRPRLKEAVFRFILRHAILVTDPPGLAAEYQRRFGLKPARIRILPHFINVSRFSPDSEYNYHRNYIREKLKIPPEAKVILFVHRLSRRKGAHLIPKIAAGVTGQRKDVIFLIVGDGPEYESLKLKVKSLKLEPYVRLVGEVAQKDIVPYFRAADVLLLPSEEEGFPHVLLEAAAAGLPFVAADVGGIREIIPPASLDNLAAPGDSNLFSEKIIGLLDKSPEDISAVVGQQLEWVKQYSLHRALANFTAFFGR